MVANGFYEWSDDALRDKTKPKVKGTFRLKQGRTFAFAGIWDLVKDDEGCDFFSFSIITVAPNQMLKSLPHHRMPAILQDEDIPGWLAPGEDPEKFLQTTGDERMECELEEIGLRK